MVSKRDFHSIDFIITHLAKSNIAINLKCTTNLYKLDRRLKKCYHFQAK